MKECSVVRAMRGEMDHWLGGREAGRVDEQPGGKEYEFTKV